jgi:anti-sigma factor RsiW
MTCSDVSELLGAFVDAELPAPMLLSVARHAGACPDCDGSIRELSALHEAVERVAREDGEALDLSGIWPAVEADIARAEARRVWSRRVRSVPAWGVALAAAAGAVLWLRTPGPSPTQDVTHRVTWSRRVARPNQAVIDRLDSGESRVAISRERKLGTTLIMVSADGNPEP